MQQFLDPIMPLLDIQSNDSDSDSKSDSSQKLLKHSKMIDYDRSALSDTFLLVHHDQDLFEPKTKFTQISETNSLIDDNKVEV